MSALPMGACSSTLQAGEQGLGAPCKGQGDPPHEPQPHVLGWRLRCPQARC